MGEFDRFQDYFHLSDLLSRPVDTREEQSYSADIMNIGTGRNSESRNFGQLEDSLLRSVEANTGNFETLFQSLNRTRRDYVWGDSVADLLQMEPVTRAQEEEDISFRSWSTGDDMEFDIGVSVGRPLLGSHSSSPSSSLCSSLSQQSTSSYHSDTMSTLPEDNFTDMQILLGQTRISRPRQARQMPPNEMYCVLCKRNGETREYYTTHVLKDNRGKIICPVLRRYVCPRCHATGDNAHTLRHCPFPESNGLGSTAQTFQTFRSSSGRRRLF